MKEKSNKKVAFVLAAALCAAIAVPAVSVLSGLSGKDEYFDFKGIYGNTFTAFAEESATGSETENAAYTMQTKGMYSLNNDYLLLTTNIDDVTKYKEVGYTVSVNGRNSFDMGSLKYYDSITFKTDAAGGTRTDTMSEIFADNAADGMIVTEIEYSAENSYSITPYLITNADVKETGTTVALSDANFPYLIEAEAYSETHGAAKVESGTGENGSDSLAFIANGDYVVYKDIKFDGTPAQFMMSYAGTGANGIEVRLDSLEGSVLAAFDLPSVDSTYRNYKTHTVNLSYGGTLNGTHDLYLKLNAGVNIDWFGFVSANTVTIEPATQTIFEGGEAEIVLGRSGGDMSDEVTVTVATVSGTAEAGTSYDALEQSVVFAAGETEKTVTVQTKERTYTDNRDLFFHVIVKEVSDNASIGYQSSARITLRASEETMPDRIQAVDYVQGSSNLLKEQKGPDGGWNIGRIYDDNYTLYSGIMFGETPGKIKVCYSGDKTPTITFRLGGADGEILAVCTLDNPNDYGNYIEREYDITYDGQALNGAYDIYVELNAGLNLAWFEFIKDSSGEASPQYTFEGANVSADGTTYSTVGNANGWYQMAYLTEPLTYGMTVELTLVKSGYGQFVIGLSPYDYVTNPTEHAWVPSHNDFKNLFVPQFNIYQGTQGDSYEDLASLTENNGDVNSAVAARIGYDDASVRPFQDGSDTVKIRFVLDDKLLIYIDDQLFESDKLPDWTTGEGEYYLSVAASNCASITITDFGNDPQIQQRGDFGTPVSSPKDKSYFSGKNITFIGDSITYGVGVSQTENRYATQLSDSLGMNETNLGISGTVYCTGYSGDRASRIDAVGDVSYETDYLLVNLGVNDFDNAIKGQFAEMGEFLSEDTSTVYGAVNAMYRYIVDRFRCTDMKIIIVTPVETSWNNSVSGDRDWNTNKENACGYTLRELCEAIIQTADYYGLPVLDLNLNSGLEPSDYSDGIHPNDAGAAKIAASIEAYLLEDFSYQH